MRISSNSLTGSVRVLLASIERPAMRDHAERVGKRTNSHPGWRRLSRDQWARRPREQGNPAWVLCPQPWPR